MARLRWAATAGILAALVLAGVATGAYRQDMAAAQAPLAGSQVIDSPFGPIEFADVGRGSVVLMIHGSGGGFDQALAFSERLDRDRFRIIAPSRFGYLRSAMPPDATPEMQADALAYLLKHLEVDQAVIFGGSAGALSAAQLALRHPERCRGLIVGVPALYGPNRAPEERAPAPWPVRALTDLALRSDLVFWMAIRIAPDLMTRMVLATEPAVLAAAGREETARANRVLRHILPISARHAGIAMDSATAGSPPPYSLEQLSCPLLAISARDDLYGTADAAAHAVALAPRGRLILFEEGGHLWAGHDAEVWAAVADFVASPDLTVTP
ncbi:MAG: alpha/beta hydrolase [Phenylobacterium sp.]|uniref:alpha/beta fold hydrolase n=1 Tax=Phenylobacterium sp. TaxID=1871053 RepID=UPI002734C194|nr:alpha/beta hydrolase [Phenylobacterium sp.]MDP1642242.1 alpha/beta hydrolase [Phenylobacterium sp.]MDP3117130.1 alpha/beta hydrolase [Phenylobacterium sp.]